MNKTGLADRIEKGLRGLRSLIFEEAEEALLQAHFQEHPYLLFPGYYPLLVYQTSPFADIIVSQLPLGVDFRVDFAFVTDATAGSYLHLIELESPKTQIFTKSRDQFTKQFNEAHHQIVDWLEWCRRNVGYLENSLSGAFGTRLPSGMIPECILIVGRRSQVATERRRQRWAAKLQSMNRGLNICTFDRPFALCLQEENKFEAFIQDTRSAVMSDGSLWVADAAPRITCTSYRQQSLVEMRNAGI